MHRCQCMRIARTASAPPWVNPDQASDAMCSLYVEEVDIGEEEPRQVVSGLVNFVPEVGFTGRRK
jgi:Putative tRNA binding domain